ncbi:hypothetical protein VE25_12430 [Devosia geojensis]|uniref:Uncharacterized protein n=1 Tax=Devosia geojensis TaxID=443610 RepID=A0A0F5FRJ1_9HYPH|nr:hypothetical protein VE25_12430 [Devosia geojensis]
MPATVTRPPPRARWPRPAQRWPRRALRYRATSLRRTRPTPPALWPVSPPSRRVPRNPTSSRAMARASTP